MEPSQISPWFSLALSAIALATVVYNWFTAGEKKVAQDLSAFSKSVAEEMAKLDKRVQVMESEMRHLPDRDAAHRLEMAVERLNGRIETLDERLKPVAAISERMQELLLEQVRR